MKRILVMALAATVSLTSALAQRTTDKLDRGLVAVPASSGSGNFVSWKILGEEYYDTEYNLYRDGTLVNSTPLKVSNYVDTGGKSSSKYQVAPVVRGVEQAKSAEVARWNAQYKDIAISGVTNRNDKDVTSKYEINDISLGDVDGDGIVEFIIKRNNTSGDLNTAANTTDFNHYECYTITGKRLWWIDLGPNLMAGPDEQWDLVAFDWDQDGKAECLMRGADNMVIHTASGKTINVGNMSYVAPRDEYTHQGAEYLLYLNGETGEPYDWDGTSENYTPMAYPLPRFEDGESDYATVWGKADTGHRSSKHYFGAPFLDGRHPSIFLGRGCYTRHKFCALDVDPLTHKLTQRWRWNEYSSSSPYFGQGYHNFQIADVDWDGRDEIMFGSMVIDDNGQGLCTTGLGHGDAQHCSDLDPYRHGQEQFVCNETSPACTYFNATTGQIYYRLQSTSDDGRALAGNFSDKFPGSMGRSTQTGLVSCVADKVINGGPATEGTNDALFWSHLNQRIYWDGDLLDEVFDSPGSNARSGAIYKPDGGRLITMDGTNTANSSKNNPGAIADILGDWREEVVMRNGTQGSKTIRIFTTNIATTYNLYTLWHDHQYRNAMVWQCVGYNQPPHKSYFVGKLEGITIAPPPLTMTGRTEVKNGGTIDSKVNDQHVIVCETNDTKVSVAEGAAPYIATFNVPSWVQGTNSRVLNGGAVINYDYFTCDVTGAAFNGSMRLVKQGDGILNLPNVEQKYTGETNIWAGTLNFDGSLLQSPVWLNRFAELNSDGGKFRSIKMDYDAKLRPGHASNIGTITTDSLVLGFGSRVIFDLKSDGLQADQVNMKYLSIETKNWTYGPKYLQPVFEFVVAENADPTPGNYLIGTVTTLNGELGNIRIEGLSPKLKSQLSLEDGKLYLIISDIRGAGAVTWTGSQSSTWDMANTENFANAEGDNDIFVTGDVVRFDDTASKFSVSLNGDLEADTILVANEAQSYTFSGNGSLTGNTTLVKQNKGTLVIKTDNSYTGGTRLSGGVVSVSSLANANQPKGNLGAVSTTATGFIMENGAELRTTAAVTNGSNIRLESEEGGVINNSADFVVDRAMAGTLLTKKGSGYMKLNVSNSALTRLVVAAGTVQCINSTVPAKTVEYQGGTLRENAGTSYAVNVPEGKTGTWYLANRSTYTNKVSGKGTLNMYCTTEKGSGWYATRTPVQCNFSDFEGILKPNSSQDDPSLLRFTLNTSTGMPKGTMNIAAGVEVQNSGKSFRMGKVTGSGNLGGGCAFSNGTNVGANTWQAGNDEDFIFAGKVTGSGTRFTKVGTGKMTVSGKWDCTGIVGVSEGELHINSGASLGTGSLTVAKDATLSGTTAASNSLTNSSVSISGTLQAGSEPTSTTGLINFGSKNLSIAKDARLVIGVEKCATAADRGCTSLAQIKKLTMNGVIVLHLAANCDLAPGDSIVLWEAESFEGTPELESVVIDAEKGLYWDVKDLAASRGVLRVTDDPTVGIASFTADKQVACEVYTVGGVYVGTFKARRADLRREIRKLGVSGGVYVVRMTGGGASVSERVVIK